MARKYDLFRFKDSPVLKSLMLLWIDAEDRAVASGKWEDRMLADTYKVSVDRLMKEAVIRRPPPQGR